MSTLLIRDARDCDRDAIAAMTLAAYQQYAALMPDLWEAYRANITATLAEVRPAEQLVAEQDGRIVGTVLLYPGGMPTQNADGVVIGQMAPEVRLLAVEPAARRQHIGEALMHECIGRARRAQATALTLHTADIMQAAMRLYQRLGFERAAELDFEPAPGALIKGYRLRLEAPPRST